MVSARSQPAIATGVDGKIYVMGGFSGGIEVNTMEIYDPLTDTWTAGAAMPQQTRGAAVAKARNGLIYLFGGAFSGILSTVQVYNTTANTWTTKTPLPVGVWMAAAVTADNGEIYVFGGSSSGAFYTYNGTQVYDPDADTWSTGADVPTGKCEFGAVKASNGLIYTIGGSNGTVLSSVEVYNPATDTWITKASMPAPKLEFGATVGPDNKIYIIGGGTSLWNDQAPFFNSVEIYDPLTNAWTVPAWSESLLTTARKELSAVTANGKIYAIGGSNGAPVNTNEEALITPPDNVAPTASIDSISPQPATRGDSISFTGHGTDSDGTVAAYKWRSSLNGTLSSAASFSTSTLVVGTHTIYFSVKDNLGGWAAEAVATVTVVRPIEEDPTYQQLQVVQEKADDLALKNDSLQAQANDLAQQNADLSDTVDALASKLDTTTMMLFATGIATLALVVIAIALVYMSRRKPAASPAAA
jgi:N-acetylneuraminic acid mutarotase